MLVGSKHCWKQSSLIKQFVQFYLTKPRRSAGLYPLARVTHLEEPDPSPVVSAASLLTFLRA